MQVTFIFHFGCRLAWASACAPCLGDVARILRKPFATRNPVQVTVTSAYSRFSWTTSQDDAGRSASKPCNTFRRSLSAFSIRTGFEP